MKRDRWVVAAGVLWLAAATQGETHWELQAVDAAGNPTHPRVIRPGYPWDPSRQVVLEGVVTVGPAELTDTASELLIAFQGEAGDAGGTQIWSGAFFQDWPEPYDAYFGLLPGDRIRVTGYAAQFIGKANINEQHTDDPARDFVIERIGHPGLPVPQAVPDVAAAITFDPTRLTGGEFYQSRWVRMNGLTITTPQTWQAGEEVTVTDGTGSMQMMLSAVGDFNGFTPPAGPFDVVALFDQEPRPLDFNALRTEHYRLWVKKMAHLLPPGSPFLSRAVSRKTHGSAGTFDIDVSVAGAIETRSGGPSWVVLTFDQPIAGAGGLDPTDVVLSSGSASPAIAGNELHLTISQAADGENLTISFPGIVSAATGTPVSGTLCFGVLAGDVNVSRQVSSADLLAVRSRLTQAVTDDNFRCDMDANGRIGSSDLLAVRGRLTRRLEAVCP